MKTTQSTLLLLLTTGIAWSARSQLSVSAQFRTRTEYRDGQGAPLTKGADPAFFTSQRTRLNAGFTGDRFKTNITIQDVRVWGQDVSTINRTVAPENNNLNLHEAWAEIRLNDTTAQMGLLNLKIGRQELVYDDQRLLGNLDWLQQARSHDAAVLKYEYRSFTLHAGAAFNQNKENASGTIYNSNPPSNYAGNTNGGNMYKSMHFVYASKKLNAGNASFLFFTDRFSKFRMDTINNVGYKNFQPGSWTRATTGFYLNNTFNKITVTGAAYYQFGKTSNAQKLSAVLASGVAHYALNSKWNVGAGIDYTSGGIHNNTSNAFDPLYGTPHKFWGLMDYFYAAAPFGKGGLTDYYLKARYKPTAKWLITADVHQFSSAAQVTYQNEKHKNFGQETDFTASFILTKIISFEGGYAHYFATPLLSAPMVKNVTNARNNANWAYLTVNIKPEFLFK